MKSNPLVWKNIFSTLRRHKWLVVGIVISVCAGIIVSLIPPLLLGKIIDQLTQSKELALASIFLYFALIAVTGVLDSLKESLLILLGQKITHQLRSRLCEKLSKLPADTLNSQEPGRTVSYFVSDVNTIETLFTSGIISMFADACKIISIMVIIFLNNKGLGLLLLFVLPVIYIFTRTVQKRMLRAQLDNRVAVSRVTNHVPESIRCIRTIHSLAKEEYMEKRYDDYIGQSYDAIERTNFYDAIYSPVILILNAVIVAILMLLSASGNPVVLSFFGMSVGTAVAVMNYVSQIFSPIESLGMEIQTIQSALAGVEHINQFLQLEERTPITENTTEFDKKQGIVLDHVTFSYDDIPVLSDLSFTIHPDERVTLAGRTGAGKSTIFKLLLGLYQPQKGHVLIYGQEAFHIPDSRKRSLFGYVEQTFHEVPGTILDQITLFDEAITPQMAETAARLVGLHETICGMDKGYLTPCHKEIFSQGQWQLLSIARAIAADPKILLLDEITANLDTDTEQNILEALGKAADGRTVCSISHRIYDCASGHIIEL